MFTEGTGCTESLKIIVNSLALSQKVRALALVYGCRPLSRKTVSHPESVLQKNYKSDRDDQRLENIKEDGKK